MDVFRIGTLLELCREVATALAADGKRVKVCVQKSMGQGVFQVGQCESKHLYKGSFMVSCGVRM